MVLENLPLGEPIVRDPFLFDPRDLPRRFLCLRVLIVEFDSILGTKKQSEKNRSRFPLRFHM